MPDLIYKNAMINKLIKHTITFILVSISQINISIASNEPTYCPIPSLSGPAVSAPPASFDIFYQKYIDDSGIAIVGSKNVCDRSLQIAFEIINKMLSSRPDIKANLVKQNLVIAVFGASEKMTDLPEDRDLAGKWIDLGHTRKFDDTCGGGGVTGRPTSVCEKNLIGFNDPYFGKMSVLIHEFGHTIQNQGLDFDTLNSISMEYVHAQSLNLFRRKDGGPSYMMSNIMEFFAEGTATWFGSADPSNPANSSEETNREHLAAYEPGLFKILSGIYPQDLWVYPNH